MRSRGDESLDDGDRLLETVEVGRLRPGQTRRETLRVGVDGSAAGLFAIAVLDATDRVFEVNEDNDVVVSPPIR